MPCPFDLVMFDLDGTLIDTAPEIADAVNDTLQHFNLPTIGLQQVTQWIGHGTVRLLESAVAFASDADAASVRSSDTFGRMAADFASRYQARCGTRSQLYPAVLDTLLALRKQDVKCAVVTNKDAVFTRALLDAHQLHPLLDMVISGDRFPARKPDPAGINYCLAEWSVPRQRALFVGDSCVDVTTARNARMQVWTVPYGYNGGQPIHACNPDRVIADCSALLLS